MYDKRNLLVALAILVIAGAATGADIGWKHLSSDSGALPVPNGNSQQTACLALDIDTDGTDDFVITERTGKPSVVWYKYRGQGKWDKFVIDDTPLHIEAGGDYHDIDGDGDIDIIGKPYSFGAPGLAVWLQDRKRSQTQGALTGAVVVVPEGADEPTVMLQTEMDKSFKIVNLLWTVMKGICYDKATQAV